MGGGKGGTGKSLVTANLGLNLAQAGHRVCLVDADLGTANLHTFLGLDSPKRTLSDFIERKVDNVHELIVWTDQNNLALISGARDIVEVANLKFVQKVKLFRHLQNLDFDFVLIDLGAGTSFNVVDFFLITDIGIFVTSPEPTAVENTYRFIKSFYYRVMSRSIKNHNLKEIVEDALRGRRGRQVHNPIELLETIDRENPETGAAIKEELASFRLKLIVNQVRTSNDFKIGRFMRSALLKYFGLQMEFVGSIVFDDKVWQSIRLRSPFMAQFPGSMAAQNLRAICESLKADSQTLLNPLKQNPTPARQRA
ncbi:MAG: P-loop NTPase [Deltaproteobacteria bacterium]|nr:P-loop NTPase [Deltaproteobacteria bacterium]